MGLALDSTGNLYIADRAANRIREVNTSGIIGTVAGNGIAGYSGDGGLATSAELNLPYGVAVDSAGNLYIAEYGGNRVRKVNTSGIISTVAGNGVPGYSGDGGPAISAELSVPCGVTLDAAGNIYIADMANYRIRKVDTLGTIGTVAGSGSPSDDMGDGGPAISAELCPYDVALDSAGNLYITDLSHYTIRRVP